MNDYLSKPMWQLTAKEFLELMEKEPNSTGVKTNVRTVRGVNNLAAELGVSSPTVHKWKKAGIIPFWQVGRIIYFDLEKVNLALNQRTKFQLK